MGAQGLEVFRGELGLELELFFGGDFFLGRNPQHAAGFAHAQAFALQNNVQRLVPGHVLQAQSDSAGHRVRCHHVKARKVGNHLQHLAHVNALKIERQLLPVVASTLCEFARVNLEGLDVNHQFRLGLVGGMFPLALGRNHHAHAVAHFGGGDGLHGRAKVVHIQAPAQALGQAHIAQFHHQVAAHLFDIRRHFAAGQRQAHPAGALACAPKINGAQRCLGAALGSYTVGRGFRRARAGGGLQRH